MMPMRSDSGPRERQPIFNAPPATLWTCLILVAIYLLLNFAGQDLHTWLIRNFAFISLVFESQFNPRTGGPSLPVMATLVTHALLHVDLMHLVLNAGFLLAFGSVMERRFGIAGFALLFVLCAVAGALTELAFNSHGLFYLIGASGAVYGMMGGFVALMMRRGGLARNMALNFVMIILVLNLLLAMLGVSDFLSGSTVAWRAHIGGFVMGFALSLLFQTLKMPSARR